MQHKTVRFSKTNQAEFIADLRKQVKAYFETNNISTYGNWKMVLKTIFMFALYFVPYLLMLTGVITNIWVVLLMWALMGLGKAELAFL